MIILPRGSRPDLSDTLTQGLVTWYPCNEASGSLINDYSPNRNVGDYDQAFGSDSWAGSPKGSALQFNGSSQSVAIPSVTLSDAFTCSFWCKPYIQKNHVPIGAGAHSSDYFIYFNGVRMYVRTTTTVFNNISALAGIIGTWFFVLIDRVAVGGLSSVYLNGELSFSNPAVTGNVVVDTIGAAQDVSFWFDGAITDFRQYDRLLTDAEKIRLQKETLPGLIAPTEPIWAFGVTAAGASLTVQQALHTMTADSPVLTQAHNLTAAGSIMSFTADSPAITQAHSLTVTDGTMSILADSPALTQGHNLAVADSTHSITADSPALTQVYLLSVAESLLSVSADSPTMIQQHSLAVAESLLSLSAESPTLTTAGALAVASAVMSVAAESPSLVQNHTLVAAQSLLSMAADSPALIQAHSLLVSDGTLTLGADSPALTQAHSLLVADGLLTIDADNVDILTAGFLNVQGADLSMLADAPVLTQVHALVVADALHSLTAESPLIGIHLIVPDSTLSVTADSPTLSAETILAVQDALMRLAADGVTLTQVHGLVVSDSLHSMLAGIPSLNEEGAPQSADRIIIVESYGKYILVARENRTIMVQ